MIHRGGGPVVELCIDTPATRNALGLDELESLARALEEIRSDPVARVALISATGPVFSSGADRRDLADPQRVARSAMVLRRILETISTMDQPVVCKVNGDAYGGAVAIIATADLSVAASGVHVALPEARFGLVATVAAAACVRRVGVTASLDLLLTGRRVAAAEARDMHLFTAVVDDASLDGWVSERIDDLLHGAPTALAVTKQLVRSLGGASIGNDLGLAESFGRGQSASEARIGAAALAARTKPEWVVEPTPAS